MSNKKVNVIHVSNLIPAEFCKFFTHVLLRQADINSGGDSQVPTAKAILDHEVMFETLQEFLWPTIEQITQQELIPTYSYARLYSNGDVLDRHTDRPACEVSVTIQLYRSHDYSWPIHMGSNSYELNVGDAVIYPGEDIEHWRNECKGPQGYYSGQVFLHYVRKNGIHTNEVNDTANRDKHTTFIKNRLI
jgi:hypothetical protein